MRARKITVLLSSMAVLVTLSVAGYWMLRRTEPDLCRICRREIHAQSRAVIELEGRREPVCCVRCALTLARQQAVAVRLVEVNDYVTQRPIRPAAAFYVEGSQVVLCEKHEPLLFDPTKHPYGRVFDRCEPSVYAFARRDEAETFAARQGGVVRTLAELLDEVKPGHDQPNH